MDKLKPCPFCGAEPVITVKDNDEYNTLNDNYDIQCGTENCYLEFGADWFHESIEKAVEQWNNRTPILLTDVEKTSSYDDL